MLAEGGSLRSASRLADVSINTVMKLLVDVGAACERYQDGALRDLKCRRIQCDEIWSFVYAKAKDLPESLRGAWGVGDVWTWTAIDADTKLVPSCAIGRRDASPAIVSSAIWPPALPIGCNSPRTGIRSSGG